MKKVISIGDAGAVGPYSPAFLSDGRLYISGQIAMDHHSGKILGGNAAEQCRVIMENISSLLANAGMDFGDLVHCRIFLADMNDFAEVNRVYASFLDEPYPARAAVEVSRLPKDVAIEIEAIAER